MNPRILRGAFTVYALAAGCLAGFAGSSTTAAIVTGTSLQNNKGPVDQKTIQNLISQLGDDAFERREAADKQLQAIGKPALDLLRKAAKDNPELEVRNHAAQLVRLIEANLFRQVRRLDGHEDPQRPWVTRVVVTPDGKLAVSAGGDGLRAWNLETGSTENTFGQPKGSMYCWSLALSREGQRVISGGDNWIARVLDVKTGKEISQLTGHKGPIWGVGFIAGGKQAITSAWDRSIRVWDVDSGKQIRDFEGVIDDVRCLAISPDEKLLAAGHFGAKNGPGILRLWDLEKGTQIREMPGHKQEISAVAFSSDGKMLLTSSFDKTLRLWEVATGKTLKELTGHSSRVECAVFTPDGRHVMSCGDQSNPTVRVWDVAAGTQVFESPQIRGGLTSLIVLPDGHQCLTAGKDSAVRLWDCAGLQ
jgi:WD40 repeat protein